jgi:hypothetical protein
MYIFVHAYNCILSYSLFLISFLYEEVFLSTLFCLLVYIHFSYKRKFIFFVTFRSEYKNNITSFLISLCSKFDGSNMINNTVVEMKDYKENSV